MPASTQGTVGQAKREMRRMLDDASAGGKGDTYAGKRGSTRFAEGTMLEVTTDPSDSGDTQSVTMHNISREGIGFQSGKDMSPGTAFFVREFSGDNSNLWIPARIRHKTPFVGGFLVGAVFEPERAALGEPNVDREAASRQAKLTPKPWQAKRPRFLRS